MNDRFKQLKPYWDALDRLFPLGIISAMKPEELKDYEKLCEAITLAQVEEEAA